MTLHLIPSCAAYVLALKQSWPGGGTGMPVPDASIVFSPSSASDSTVTVPP